MTKIYAFMNLIVPAKVFFINPVILNVYFEPEKSKAIFTSVAPVNVS